MRILIIGFGSIGQRHYKNLLKLGFNDVYIYDTDKVKTVGKELKLIKKLNIAELGNFDVTFVCTPNNSHIKIANQCAQAGCHLFIEKPLSHNLKGIDSLLKICKQKKLINMVGCNMRFHPGLKLVKNFLNKNKLGKIYSINHEFGYYLPYWRPKEDYQKNYAAKKASGGGIILDDIHEFDLLFYLNDYQPVTKSKFIFDKVSDLKIKTEDICFASFQFKNKVLGSVRCDYLQQNYSRNCKIVGEKGNLELDFEKNIVWLKNKQGSKKLFELKRSDNNDDYIEEIKYFLDCVKKKKNPEFDIAKGYKILKIVLTAKNLV